MIKNRLYLIIKKLILIYLYIFPGKIKFKLLSSLNFKIIDFNNYEKNKNLIFKKDFFKIDHPIIYNYDFVNLCNTLGGKKGIEIAKFGIFRWYEANKFKAKLVWDSKQTANRILNLVNNFDFINSISTKTDDYKLKKILKINIKSFNRFIFTKNFNEYSLLEFKAYILIKYILDEKIGNIKKKCELILEKQIDGFSMHKTYNLFEQAKFINNINEIISMLLNFKIEVPEILSVTKIKI